MKHDEVTSMENNYYDTPWTYEPPKPLPVDKRELIFAVLSIFCGMILCNFTLFGGFNLGFARSDDGAVPQIARLTEHGDSTVAQRAREALANRRDAEWDFRGWNFADWYAGRFS